MGTFVKSTRSNGEFQFNLLAGNGQVILTSEGYSSAACRDNGIESVRKHAPDSTNYEKKTAANSKFHFNLKASNGQVIGTGQLYETEAGRDNGIASVMENAPGADVREA